MGHFHTLTYADAHVTSLFESAHKRSIAPALSEVFGARQSLTFRYPLSNFAPPMHMYDRTAPAGNDHLRE
jgi:hypothetical protein